MPYLGIVRCFYVFEQRSFSEQSDPFCGSCRPPGWCGNHHPLRPPEKRRPAHGRSVREPDAPADDRRRQKQKEKTAEPPDLFQAFNCFVVIQIDKSVPVPAGEYEIRRQQQQIQNQSFPVKPMHSKLPRHSVYHAAMIFASANNCPDYGTGGCGIILTEQMNGHFFLTAGGMIHGTDPCDSFDRRFLHRQNARGTPESGTARTLHPPFCQTRCPCRRHAHPRRRRTVRLADVPRQAGITASCISASNPV